MVAQAHPRQAGARAEPPDRHRDGPPSRGRPSLDTRWEVGTARPARDQDPRPAGPLYDDRDGADQSRHRPATQAGRRTLTRHGATAPAGSSHRGSRAPSRGPAPSQGHEQRVRRQPPLLLPPRTVEPLAAIRLHRYDAHPRSTGRGAQRRPEKLHRAPQGGVVWDDEVRRAVRPRAGRRAIGNGGHGAGESPAGVRSGSPAAGGQRGEASRPQ